MGSIHLEPELEEKISRIAEWKGLTVSEVHHLALEQYCNREISEIPERAEAPRDEAAELMSRRKEMITDIMMKKFAARMQERRSDR